MLYSENALGEKGNKIDSFMNTVRLKFLILRNNGLLEVIVVIKWRKTLAAYIIRDGFGDMGELDCKIKC